MLALAGVLGLLCFATPCRAGCSGLCICSHSTTGVNFGPYSMLTREATDATGAVTVTCLLSVSLAGSFTVELSPGVSGSYATRTMTNGGAALGYNLYTSESRASIWGDGTSGSGSVTRPIKYVVGVFSTVDTLPIYGRIPAGQNVPAGSYTDTVVVTIIY
jgi:spore coat protein U-like protein